MKKEKKYLIRDTIIIILCFWALMLYEDGFVLYVLLFSFGFVFCYWLGSLGGLLRINKGGEKTGFFEDIKKWYTQFHINKIFGLGKEKGKGILTWIKKEMKK